MSTSLLILQLADSGFPTGGFAHSSGLEAAVQHGEISSRGELVGFLKSWLWQTGFGALPLVSAAHREPDRLSDWNERAETFLVSHVARRASCTQGRAFLDTCARVFGEVQPLQAQALSPTHHAPIFGAVLRALAVSEAETQQLFLSIGLRGVLSAAVRLGVTGTHDAQRLQHALASTVTEVLTRCGPLGAEELAQTAPLLDLFGATHDRLYSRLFQS